MFGFDQPSDEQKNNNQDYYKNYDWNSDLRQPSTTALSKIEMAATPAPSIVETKH